jgi:hypothetical protein
LYKIDKQWTKPYEAIVDTGAPISILPFSLWKMIDVEVLGSHVISGIVPKKECSLPVKVGRITCRLVDLKSISQNFKLLTYLSPTDRTPLILGFEGALIKSEISFNYKEKKAYCHFK